MGGSLPKEHHVVIIDPGTPILKIVRIYFRKWLIHPIKRRIAKYYLVLLKVLGIKVIAITGSAGKTSTKEMLASILKIKGRVVYSFANIDPVYNIPTTILKCTPRTKYLILEMGVEYPGEMDYYLWLAKPDIGIITNIYPTHILYFKSLYGVFNEKSKLAKYLSKEKYIILNWQDDYLKKLGGKIRSHIFKAGKMGDKLWNTSGTYKNGLNEFFIYQKLNNKEYSIKIHLKSLGEHNIANAMFASSAAHLLGLTLEEIKLGLEDYLPPEHRMNIITHNSGALIIDDSYNSNPEALKATLKTYFLTINPKNKIIVLGDMLELGGMDRELHTEIGKVLNSYIKKYPIKLLITVGSSSKWISEYAKKNIYNTDFMHVTDKTNILKHLMPFLKKDYGILIKGSRSLGLDSVVTFLMKTT